jgi:hypothetical protein
MVKWIGRTSGTVEPSGIVSGKAAEDDNLHWEAEKQ